jgi:hypothetical protein
MIKTIIGIHLVIYSVSYLFRCESIFQRARHSVNDTTIGPAISTLLANSFISYRSPFLGKPALSPAWLVKKHNI